MEITNVEYHKRKQGRSYTMTQLTQLSERESKRLIRRVLRKFASTQGVDAVPSFKMHSNWDSIYSSSGEVNDIFTISTSPTATSPHKTRKERKEIKKKNKKTQRKLDLVQSQYQKLSLLQQEVLLGTDKNIVAAVKKQLQPSTT